MLYLRLGLCRVKLHYGIVLKDEFWASFQGNFVIANEKNDSVPKKVQLDTTLTQSHALHDFF